MGKGVLVFVAVVVIFVMISAATRYLIASYKDDRKTRAVNGARWTTYTEPKGDQTIEVGVHKVASWGLRHTEVLKTEKLVDVRINPYGVGDVSLDEAKDAANRLADTYNAEVE